MTLKSYLRMLLAAVTLMFVTTGCNDDEEKVGPPPSYTFGIAVSDVTETEATVTVTPSNDQATYYYGAVKKADFDAFESDAAYAQNILATLKAAADRKVLSLEEYLQTALSKGSSPKKIADLTAGTDYYAVAIGILTDGRLTSDLVKEAFKTVAAPEPAPELTLAFRAGDDGGANTNTKGYMEAYAPTATGAYYGVFLTSDVEKVLAQGSSYDAIVTQNGTDMSTKDGWLEALVKNPGIGVTFGGLAPATSYTCILKVTDLAGKSTTKYATASTDAGQGGGDQTFSVSVTNIGDKGADITVTPSNSDPYFWGWIESSKIEGATDAEIIQAQLPIEVENLSTGAESISREVFEQYAPFTPNTQYTILVFGTSADGTSATTGLTKKEFTTTNGGDVEPSDAYKAWLGTWTVTSTSSELNKAPLSFDVIISQKAANTTYSVAGWSITAIREQPIEAIFDAESGRLGLINEQEITTVKFEGKDYLVTYISRCLTSGKYSYVFGDYAGLIGELDASKSKATVVGNTLKLQGGGEAVVHSMEFFGFETNDGDGLIKYNPAEGFTKDDYPIGPYTMTKKSAATSMSVSRSAVLDNGLLYAGKLSSVLSARAVVSAPAKQNLVEAKASILNSLTFEKPVGVYEATISTLQISRSL